MPNKLTTEEFIGKARSVHGNKCDYSKVVYRGNNISVIITCREHGNFVQAPSSHIQGRGCPVCSRARTVAARTSTTDEFVEKAKKTHGDKYGYEKVVYTRAIDRVVITCPTHGVFEQRPCDHLLGKGCVPCSFEQSASKNSLGTDEFIKRAREIFGDQYDYSLVEYKNANTRVDIICRTHGVFSQWASALMYHGCGCPQCNDGKSKGEKEILNIFEKTHIEYSRFKKFPGCRDKYPLEFDFYLPEHNVLIEYDGIQHFQPIEFWGGEEAFESQQKRDTVKNKFVADNGYTLIRIPYTEFNNIEKILLDNLSLMEK